MQVYFIQLSSPRTGSQDFFYPYCFDYNILYGSIMNMLKQLCQLFQPNSISSHKNLSIKHLPTIFNLQKCYHPVSFICAWSMPPYKINRKERYISIEAELSLLVYLLYLFMHTSITTRGEGDTIHTISPANFQAVYRRHSKTLIFRIRLNSKSWESVHVFP